MGGERETFLQGEEKSAGVPAGSAGSATQTSGERVRIHESAGQVHFHDDANHLKVAVPVATWWRAWQELQQAGRWDYIDVDNKAVLSVETKVAADRVGNTLSVESHITLQRLDNVGTNFTALSKFTKRR